MILNRLKAWLALLKLGQHGMGLIKEEQTYMRGNIVRILKKEGWFDFLKTPHTANEILTNFRYKDEIFLQEILDVFVQDKTLILDAAKRYKLNEPLNEKWLLPKVFCEGLDSVLQNYARSLPQRLKNEPIAFSGGMDLFNWDDALTDKVYEQLRRAALAFSGALSKEGRFLDVGCGNGYGTTAIWTYYYKKNRFYKGTKMQVDAIDIDESLLKIAVEEFPKRLQKRLPDLQNIESLTPYFPKFQKGNVMQIPFEDNSFDIVYVSQVLHWIDSRAAIKELIRVLKPSGILFGTEFLLPNANKYTNFHVQVVKDATGFFYKEDLVRWAIEAGAKKIETSTPITVFKITKK